MNIKELKEIIKDLDDDVEVMAVDVCANWTWEFYQAEVSTVEEDGTQILYLIGDQI